MDEEDKDFYMKTRKGYDHLNEDKLKNFVEAGIGAITEVENKNKVNLNELEKDSFRAYFPPLSAREKVEVLSMTVEEIQAIMTVEEKYKRMLNFIKCCIFHDNFREINSAARELLKIIGET